MSIVSKVVTLVQKQAGTGQQNKDYFFKPTKNKLENLKK